MVSKFFASLDPTTLEDVTSADVIAHISAQIGVATLDPQIKEFVRKETTLNFGRLNRATLVDDSLYLGSFYNAEDLAWAQEVKVKFVINMTVPAEGHQEKRLPGVTYAHFPLEDVPAADILAHLSPCVHLITAAIASGNVVLVHCMQGVSRSATVAAAYLMKKNKWTVKQALEHLKARRDIVKPNEGFLKQLESYQERIMPK
jgi:protein phosphatase slingshot